MTQTMGTVAERLIGQYNEAQAQLEEALADRDAWKARAEAAEVEVTRLRQQREEELRARLLAEADNAALLEVLRDAEVDLRAGRKANLTLPGIHPGAALLERLRAADELREQAEATRRHVRDGTPLPDASQDLLLAEACESYDALKGGGR